MKKVIFIMVAIILLLTVIGIVFVIFTGNNTKTLNDDAEKNENSRYLTIINKTNQIINEVHITVGNGTEIENMKQTNPDETSFSIEIPKQYSEYKTFTVILIDRYDLKYVKEINNVSDKGRTEVVVTEEDYVEGEGDFWNKVDKWFNGD